MVFTPAPQQLPGIKGKFRVSLSQLSILREGGKMGPPIQKEYTTVPGEITRMGLILLGETEEERKGKGTERNGDQREPVKNDLRELVKAGTRWVLLNTASCRWQGGQLGSYILGCETWTFSGLGHSQIERRSMSCCQRELARRLELPD